jgi:hypothetical protein
VSAFSDHIVYVDESGDHSLDPIDPLYPVFVLSFCIFEKRRYVRETVPLFQSFKFDHFGHDAIVLHSHEIRKSSGPFRILLNAAIRAKFTDELTMAMASSEFTLVTAVIDKAKLKKAYARPDSPYDIALTFCLERTFAFLKDNGAHAKGVAHVIVERRGEREDKELELTFRRVCQGANMWGKLPFEPVFAAKSANSIGLQISDLVAHPIGRHFLKPDQKNRAFDVLEPKFRRSPTGKTDGWGLKVFP